MPKKDSRPAAMRARRNRDGTSTFYMVRPDGERLILGMDLRIACSRWLDEQHARAKAVSSSTALSLLDAFGKCSLPFDSEQVTARSIREVKILQEFFQSAVTRLWRPSAVRMSSLPGTKGASGPLPRTGWSGCSGYCGSLLSNSRSRMKIAPGNPSISARPAFKCKRSTSSTLSRLPRSRS